MGITDKAISKWERGLSCPDISLLSELSNILEVSVGELLSGEKAEVCKTDHVDGIVETVLDYADTFTKNKAKNTRLVLGGIISSLFVVGIIVCSICNVAISGNLTWAWFPISALVYLWLIAMPIILWSHRGVCTSIIFTSLLTIPFLFALEKIIGIEGLIMSLGFPISIIVILYLWIAYLLIEKAKWPQYIAVAVTIITGLPLIFSINYIVSKQTGEAITDLWDILSYLILLIIAATILGCGYAKHKAKSHV